ncbi:helix-turn-helix domain-containing protein [Ruminococcus difficilis]|uniref:Helix-turn-helix transcriptional regulator n=1 Tax=Ruminococcus difficilis TaxID=2763069 RepID=A0A934TZ08_9FIRM|nr:helix-turn-helix transcriptional regulator [Ruminococcus difficilis]MBK6088157.1 helix-turn-helix transcriptional regulator [Ruminococcus difficilis]
MDEFKKVVAENITRLRTSMNLTQAQLGEMLNYSDKSISKWERGESIPDVFVLKKIADLGGVTVDYIITPHSDDEDIKPEKNTGRRYSRRFITLTVLAGIWALAVLLFVILWIAGYVNWLIFIYAIPVSLITLLVLNSVWGDRSWNLYIISGLVWGIICSVYLTALQYNWWQLFLLGIPAQIIIIFAFSIKKKPKKNKTTG